MSTTNDPIANLALSNNNTQVSFSGWTTKGTLGTALGLDPSIPRGVGTLDPNGNYAQPTTYLPSGTPGRPDQPFAQRLKARRGTILEDLCPFAVEDGRRRVHQFGNRKGLVCGNAPREINRVHDDEAAGYRAGRACSMVSPAAVRGLNPFHDGSRYACLSCSPLRYRPKYAVAKWSRMLFMRTVSHTASA